MTASRRTHYDVLGLRPNASPRSIREAYLNLARLVHPDRHQHRSVPERALAERRMREVTAAWAVLGDAASRAQYDREITSDRPPGASAERDAGRGGRDTGGGSHDELDDSAETGDSDAEDDEGIEVSRAVYHLLTKGPLVALIAVAVLILVFTAYARPSSTDPTIPGSTTPAFATPSTFEMDPDR